MKRFLAIIILFLLVSVGAVARPAEGKPEISALNITEDNNEVVVTFDARIPKKTVRSNYTLICSPVLTDGNYSVSLPAIIVRGNNAARTHKRRQMVTGEDLFCADAVYTRNGSIVTYSASVEAQGWMQGAELIIENALFGCCSLLEYGSDPVANDIRLWETPDLSAAMETVVAVPVEIAEEEESPVFIPETLADTLSISFPFVVAAEKFDSNDPFRIYDDERENALIIYFEQSSSTINKAYRGNEQILTNLTSVVKLIREDRRSEVEKIVVGGFASPEGGYHINDRLAFERAVSVKEHIMKTTGMPDKDILIYNGSVDWRGLRYMIAKTNILERDQIIRIIDEVPIWDSKANRGRLGELMRLNGGITYRFLLSEYFPLMRNGAFIKVYYKNN